MFRKTRGRAVIVNNMYFVKASVREGSGNDFVDLQKLFNALHFHVVPHANISAQVCAPTA